MESSPREQVLRMKLDLSTLQLFIESMLLNLPPDLQRRTLETFAEACESAVAAALSFAQQDATVHAMQAANSAQWERLRRLGGLPLPPLRQQ